MFSRSWKLFRPVVLKWLESVPVDVVKMQLLINWRTGVGWGWGWGLGFGNSSQIPREVPILVYRPVARARRSLWSTRYCSSISLKQSPIQAFPDSIPKFPCLPKQHMACILGLQVASAVESQLGTKHTTQAFLEDASSCQSQICPG